MMKKNFNYGLLTAVLAFAIPMSAHATGLDISNMLLFLIDAFATILLPTAVLVVTISGFVLMVSTDENNISKARSALVAAMIGGIVATILLFYPGGPAGFIGIMYNSLPFSPSSRLFLIDTSASLGTEAGGVSTWLAEMTVMIGLFTVIISVFRAVASFGGDEAAYGAVKTSILHVILGLILIASVKVIRDVFFDIHDPLPLINILASKAFLVMNLITTVAVGILVYAGLRMVISYGKEDEFTAAKSLSIRVVVGLIVVLLSYVMVFTVWKLFNP